MSMALSSTMSLQRCMLTLLSVLLAFLNSLQAARIAMMPLFGCQHFKVFSRLGEELQQRGHKVLLFVGDESNYQTSGSQMTQIFSTQNASKINEFLQGTIYTKGSLPIYRMLKLFSLQHEYCNAFFNDKQVFQQLSTADLVVGNAMYACSALAAAMVNVPHVVVETSLSTPSYAQKILAKFPDLSNGFMDNAGFYVDHFTLIGLGMGNLEHGYEDIKQKYGIKPGEEIWETLDKVDLVLVERNRMDYRDTPLRTNVRVVGSLMSESKDSIQHDLEDFISSPGHDGLVVVVCDAVMNSQALETLHVALARLPHNVILKIKGNLNQRKLSSNVKLVEYIPRGIIGHSKTKLLITDGTISIAFDAVTNGVPLIFLSSHDRSQPELTQSLLKFGAGEIVELDKATVEDVVRLFNKVIQEKRYKENVLLLSRIASMHPQTPLQQAAAFIECYIIGNQACINEPKRLDTTHYHFFDTFLSIGVMLSVTFSILKKMVEVCYGQSEKTIT